MPTPEYRSVEDRDADVFTEGALFGCAGEECIGAFVGDELIGCILWDELEDMSAFLHGIWVHPDHRRQGIAAELCRLAVLSRPGRDLSTGASITGWTLFSEPGRTFEATMVERFGGQRDH